MMNLNQIKARRVKCVTYHVCCGNTGEVDAPQVLLCFAFVYIKLGQLGPQLLCLCQLLETNKNREKEGEGRKKWLAHIHGTIDVACANRS